MKKFLYFTFATAITLFMTACDEEKHIEPEDPFTPEPIANSNSVFVLTQGNFYSGIEGGLNVIDYKAQTIKTNVFRAANNISLGDTPQCGVAYGSKIYVGTSTSNTIEVMDAITFKSISRITLSTDITGISPRSMVASRGKIYVSMYDGYLAQLDTTTLAVENRVKVGDNPEKIALYNGKIYVPNSGGMNYPTYNNTASIVDPNTMTVEKTITVGLNPTEFVVVDDKLFLLCMGDYADVESKVYEIKQDGTSTEICNATMIAALDDDLAIVNEPFTNGEPIVEYKLYNVDGNLLTDWNIERPDYAMAIYHDDNADMVYVASYNMNGLYPDYNNPGYVNAYDEDNFRLIKKYDLGSGGPACIFTRMK